MFNLNNTKCIFFTAQCSAVYFPWCMQEGQDVRAQPGNNIWMSSSSKLPLGWHF